MAYRLLPIRAEDEDWAGKAIPAGRGSPRLRRARSTELWPAPSGLAPSCFGGIANVPRSKGLEHFLAVARRIRPVDHAGDAPFLVDDESDALVHAEHAEGGAEQA
jgi:hypothetical protein